jgi:hypothetical protein
LCKAAGKIASLVLAMMLAAILSACTAGPIVQVGAPTRLSTAEPTSTAVKLELAQAREMIKDWLAKEIPGFNMDSLKELQETDFGIDKLFEETGSQYFALNSSSYGIVNGKVFNLGFFTPLSAVNADVDSDGCYETVLLVDTGSGRYIRQLYVVKEGVLYKHLIENSGEQQEYRLVETDTGKVVLYKVRYNANGNAADETMVGMVVLDNGEVEVN